VTPPRYAFLVMKEHPYGREMLSQLLRAGFTPELVLEESSASADEERAKFYERLAGQPLPPSFDELAAQLAAGTFGQRQELRRVEVPHHNRDECEALLAELSPDLIVLGGTRILRPRIFRHARCATLNSHPGLLPEVRGSASVAWSIYHDVPIGCTCHFIDEQIDAGPIVGRREIPVRRGQSYEELVRETLILSGTLMVEALRDYTRGQLVGVPQPPGGQTFRVMPAELVADVKLKLDAGLYRQALDAR
jgi:methionyl-tRNA formyltransferase